MSTYNEFSIQGVVPDLSLKRITIKTNFKVDANSINLKTVYFYNYDTNELMNYSLKVNNKEIYIDLDEFPDNNVRYYLQVKDIKDALGRTIFAKYNDYIQFYPDIRTSVKIMSPGSRETLNTYDIPVRLSIKDYEGLLTYRIEVSHDNIFHSNVTTTTVVINNDEEVKNTIIVDEQTGEEIEKRIPVDKKLDVIIRVEREGQVYIRARAEQSEELHGDWSEFISFNIYTVPMDSLDTTFLEDYVTSNDLFDEPTFMEEETETLDKTADLESGVLFIELNKNIKLPNNYELDENGYINLGTMFGTRKEIK